jgi:hypothetical protein
MVRHHLLSSTSGPMAIVFMGNAHRGFFKGGGNEARKGENREINLPNSPHEVSDASGIAAVLGCSRCNALWPHPRSLLGCAKRPRKEQGGGREPAPRSAVIQIILASRVLYGLNRQGQLPAIFAEVSPKTPLFVHLSREPTAHLDMRAEALRKQARLLSAREARVGNR